MRFLAPVSIVLLAVQGSSAAPGEAHKERDAVQAAVVDAAEARGDESLAALGKRQCVDNGCRCDSRGRQFRSCGNCVWTDTGSWVITAKRDATHVYECAPDGSCCDYGFANDCGGSGARCYLQ
ncbi:hypothetical protein MFIFM68171_07309 [Madurella fahalii]|uniref:Uncharacterized protein n=1 Tax=Madurella fahalii TaxID=1157608 RepID=A0ABQ0GHE8_9PEZI